MPFARVLSIFFCVNVVLFASCSFNYAEGLDGEKPYPDMEMTGASLSRYEDARLSLALSAGMLEIYDADRVWAGSDVSLVQYKGDGSGQIESEASAGLVLIDDSNATYSLGGTVRFHLVKDDMLLLADDLRWEKSTNRLSGTKSGEVEVSDGDGTVLRGTGFSADTLSREYRFDNPVSGEMVSGTDIGTDGDRYGDATARNADEGDGGNR